MRLGDPGAVQVRAQFPLDEKLAPPPRLPQNTTARDVTMNKGPSLAPARPAGRPRTVWGTRSMRCWRRASAKAAAADVLASTATVAALAATAASASLAAATACANLRAGKTARSG